MALWHRLTQPGKASLMLRVACGTTAAATVYAVIMYQAAKRNGLLMLVGLFQPLHHIVFPLSM